MTMEKRQVLEVLCQSAQALVTFTRSLRSSSLRARVRSLLPHLEAAETVEFSVVLGSDRIGFPGWRVGPSPALSRNTPAKSGESHNGEV